MHFAAGVPVDETGAVGQSRVSVDTNLTNNRVLDNIEFAGSQGIRNSKLMSSLTHLCRARSATRNPDSLLVCDPGKAFRRHRCRADR